MSEVWERVKKCLSLVPFPLPQDEELARQLQLELNAMSDVQGRGEGVTVPLHGDLQSTLTVSHHVSLTWEYMYDMVSPLIWTCIHLLSTYSYRVSVYHFHRMRIMLVSCSLSLILVHKVM